VNYNPGIIHAGEKINIIPERCILEMDFRIPWGFSARGLTEWIMENSGDAQCDILTAFEPTFTSPHAPIVGYLSSEIMRLYGKPARPIVQWAATDARYLRNHGFDVVDYGPGEITMLHAVNEYVREEDLKNAVEIYCGVMGNYC
jgi:succinyl-diaminopimelate desuccinylase